MKSKPNRKKCRKVCFNSKSQARTALNTYGKDRGSKRFYKCPYHNKETWHLTRQSKK